MTRSEAAQLTERLIHHLRVTQNVILRWNITNYNLNTEATLTPPRRTPPRPPLKAPRALLRPSAPAALRSQRQVSARSHFGSLRIEAQRQKVEPEMILLPVPRLVHGTWSRRNTLSLRSKQNGRQAAAAYPNGRRAAISRFPPELAAPRSRETTRGRWLGRTETRTAGGDAELQARLARCMLGTRVWAQPGGTAHAQKGPAGAVPRAHGGPIVGIIAPGLQGRAGLSGSAWLRWLYNFTAKTK